MSVDREKTQCESCANICHDPKACDCCEEECESAWDAGVRLPIPDLLCRDCRTKCANCDREVCEDHLSGRECIACAGPTEAQLQRMLSQ